MPMFTSGFLSEVAIATYNTIVCACVCIRIMRTCVVYVRS